MSEVMDFLMWVGVEHYPTMSSYVTEAMTQGVSKRIPKTMIPDIAPGESRLFLIYPTAFVHIRHGTYRQLVEKLDPSFWLQFEEEELEELDRHWYGTDDPAFSHTPLPVGLYRIKLLLENMECDQANKLAELEEEFGITYHPAVIGYTYLTSIVYVAGDDEDGLPEDMQHLEGVVEPVRIEVK